MKLNKAFIENFNKTKTKEKYSEVMSLYFPDAPKCRCCGEYIYYYDSTFLIKKTGELDTRNKSFKSIKSILGVDYNLSACEDCLTKAYPEYANANKSKVFNRICDMTNFAFNIPADAAKAWSGQNYALTEAKFIEKYGEVDGKNKWKEYCDKQATTNTFEYKAEKYGWTKEQFDEYNQSRAVTLENMIKRHGEVDGKKQFDEYCEQQRYTCSLEYFVKEYGEVDGTEKYKNFVRSRASNGTCSAVSQIVFDALRAKCPDYVFHYSNHNGEKIYIDSDMKAYALDCLIETLNIGIEFNGDIWHGNPTMYKANDYPIPFTLISKHLTAQEIWDNDERKINYLKSQLRDVIVIWESELNQKGLSVLVDELVERLKIYE